MVLLPFGYGFYSLDLPAVVRSTRWSVSENDNPSNNENGKRKASANQHCYGEYPLLLVTRRLELAF
jgi:hypothetical protein